MQQRQRLQRPDDGASSLIARLVLLLLFEVLWLLAKSSSLATAFQRCGSTRRPTTHRRRRRNLFHVGVFPPPRQPYRSTLCRLSLQAQGRQQTPPGSYTQQLWASPGQRPGANRQDDDVAAKEADNNSDSSSVVFTIAEASEPAVGNDADMGGFANYLIPYALTAVASLVATGLFVKFVLLDF